MDDSPNFTCKTFLLYGISLAIYNLVVKSWFNKTLSFNYMSKFNNNNSEIHIEYYVTGFTKTIPNSTRTEIQFIA